MSFFITSFKVKLKLFRKLSFVSHGLQGLGFLWVIVEVLAYFSDTIGEKIKSYPLVFFGLTLLYGVWRAWPKTFFSYQLNGRDITICLQVKNAFDLPGAIVVPINTSFDNSVKNRTVTAKSVHGQMLREYYSSEVKYLDIATKEALEEQGLTLNEEQPLGTTVIIRHDQRTFYLLASTKLNEHGISSMNEVDLYSVLSSFWNYVYSQGEKGDLVIPVIGTGRGRTTMKREDVIKLIIDSFIASCSKSATCDKLTIAIRPEDFDKHSLQMRELEEYLSYRCRYSSFSDPTLAQAGKELGGSNNLNDQEIGRIDIT